MKFSNARFVYSGKEENVKAENISPQEYRTKYYKKLYCPNPECSAMLSHFEIAKNKHRFFRTFKGFEHIKNCSYDKLYTGQHSDFKQGEQIEVNIPDEDIMARLKRAYDKYVNPIKSKKREENPKLNRGSVVQGTDNKYIPASFDEGIDADNKRLPPIYSRTVKEVTDADKDEVRCIIGKVYSMKIERNHAYINLTPKKEDSVNVLFNPHFRDRYTNLYNQLSIINKYIKSMKSTKNKIICCCIGWVRVVGNKDVKHKYNIELLKDVAITLNGKELRTIITILE